MSSTPTAVDFPSQVNPATREVSSTSAVSPLDTSTPTPNSGSDEKERKERRVSLISEDNKPVETVVSSSGHFQFAVAGKTGLQDSVKHNGTTIVPAFNLKTFWESGLVKFPSGIAHYGSDTQLIEDIHHFVRRYANVPREWLEIVTLYILMTWVYDRFTAVPYLRFLGEPGTGKSRLQQVCGAISYKATVLSGNITGASLFRTIHLVRGTMIVDEGDFKNSDEWSDITKILNTGYTVGAPVIRCERGGDDFTPQAFEIYGPKIISTRSRFADDALESRCLTFETREELLPSHIPFQLPLSFEEESIVLRNKLLHWRFKNFQRIRAHEEGLRHLSPRSGQIGASLAAVAPDEETRGKLVDFLARRDADRRGDSPKGIVLQAIARLKTEDFFSRDGKASATVGEVAAAARNLCAELGVDEMTPKRVGGIMRSLGITPHKTKHGFTIDLSKVNVPGERVNIERERGV
ncbi:MAG TPA: hypothetical protein VNY24_15320 [Candidatus Acidoferrales bacterium]|nr:hypothetical protein [Candidatus Acidoferrales bacterium]